MLTFKEWLFESLKSSEISINPKSPIAAYQELLPAEKYREARGGDEYVFKAIYASDKDKIYAWWAGADIHGEILHQFNIDYEFSSGGGYLNQDFDDLIKDNIPYVVFMYFNAKDRYMEISADTDRERDKNWHKLIYRGRFKTWASKFKTIKHMSFMNSKFKKFI